MAEITMGKMRAAMRTDRPFPIGRCAQCLADGRDVAATAKEIHSCGDKHHNRIMRDIYRSARGMARRVTGIR